MLADSRYANIKKCSHCLLSTPNCFFGIHHFHTIYLTLCLKYQELRCTIPYYSMFRHIIKYFILTIRSATKETLA